MVGQEFIKILGQRHFPMNSLQLFASDRSAGRKVTVNGEELVVKETTQHSFDGVDIALFSAGSETSHHFSPIAALKSGPLNSSTKRSNAAPHSSSSSR